MFDVGDQVKVNDATQRTGYVREVTADGRYKVCFDAANLNCSIFSATQLTLVKDETPAPGA